MNQKHIIFFNPKGGVGKSTLCERTAMELTRLNRSVSVGNTDQQEHVNATDNENAEFCLYDTMGAYSSENMALLKAASATGLNSLIVIPTGTGKNDFKDIEFLTKQLVKHDLIDKSVFVFTRVRKSSASLKKKRELLAKMGLRYSRYTMPTLEDFAEERDTSRTRNEISQFIHEVIL